MQETAKCHFHKFKRIISGNPLFIRYVIIATRCKPTKFIGKDLLSPIMKKKLIGLAIISAILCLNIAAAIPLDLTAYAQLPSGTKTADGAGVYLDNNFWSSIGNTDASGNFRMNISPGQHTIKVYWHGYSGSKTFFANQNSGLWISVYLTRM